MKRHSSLYITYGALLFAIALIVAGLSGCSMVFSSSINGRVLDFETRQDGTVQGVADARVYLYTEKKAWEADYDAYVDGDASTLPDAAGKASYDYFQSTATNASGNYQFSGIVWHTYFSQFGKTADRKEIYLLVYHPDYGIARNTTPYFIVSDVTTELPALEIEDVWNEGMISGQVKNWKDGSALANTTVAIYVPDEWSYTSASAVDDASLQFPRAPTYRVTTDAQGYWSQTIRFRKMPGHSDTVNKTKVLVTWPGADWRAEDPAAGAPAGTSINAGLVLGNRDINMDGRTAMQGDNNDWYLLSPEIQEGNSVVDTGTVTLQRWKFRTLVSGRVVNNATSAGISGVSLTLTVPGPVGKDYTTTSSPQETQAGIEDGFFNFGEIVWEITDISDANDKKTGKVPVTWLATAYTINSGAPATLSPDQNLFVVLRVSP